MLLFSAAQAGTRQFQAVLPEISGELSLCKTDSCRMLKDIEALFPPCTSLLYTHCLQHCLVWAVKPGTCWGWCVLSEGSAAVCCRLQWEQCLQVPNVVNEILSVNFFFLLSDSEVFEACFPYCMLTCREQLMESVML